jgi:hypothetical protein
LDVIVLKLVAIKSIKVSQKLIEYGHISVNNLLCKKVNYQLRCLDVLTFSKLCHKWFLFFRKYNSIRKPAAVFPFSLKIIYKHFWAEIN